MLRRLLLLVTVQAIINYVTINSQLAVGEDCISDTGGNGRCVLIEECQSALTMIRNGSKPKLCGFEGKTPIACCENIILKIPTVAGRKCLEYRQKFITTTTIARTVSTTTKRPLATAAPIPCDPSLVENVDEAIGGVDAFPLEFPHMALLGYGESNNIKWQCGGSLISENFVLTAAHCIFSKYGNVSQIKLGIHQITLVPSFVQTFGVKKTHLHPKYSPLQNYHDIALIELDHSANIHTGVKPACLYTVKHLPSNSFIGTGWGAIELYGNIHDVLQKVNLSYVEHDACAEYYKLQSRLPNGLIEDLQMCADGGGARADTCQGDSGGPLQFHRVGDENNLHTIVGITSFGIKCDIVPAVYTRVSYYVPWIESIVWPN